MAILKLSQFGRVYQFIYGKICGQSPHERPWHFQWLSTLYLHKRLLQLLPNYGGKILDVGCGEKPYQSWFSDVTEYVGIDLEQGPNVDMVVNDNMQWGLPEQSFDVVISTQVVEHASDIELFFKEISRVIKPGGTIILSFPFLYNVHGAPHDYRRFTHHGAAKLLPEYDLLHLETQGGIGSTLVILFLNWIDTALSHNSTTKFMKVLVMPIFIPLSFILNILGLILDKIDKTQMFYSNILLISKKSLVEL